LGCENINTRWLTTSVTNRNYYKLSWSGSPNAIALSLVANKSDNIDPETLQDMYVNIEDFLPNGYTLDTKCTYDLNQDEFDFLMTKTFDKSDNDLKYAKCPLPRTVVVS